MEEIDLYRTALLMIQKHGEAAAIEAAVKADKLLERGDMAGAKTWREIVKKIDLLQSHKTDDLTQH